MFLLRIAAAQEPKRSSLHLNWPLGEMRAHGAGEHTEGMRRSSRFQHHIQGHPRKEVMAETLVCSVFNSAPVEHGTQENPKSPAEDGETKPGNSPGMPIHWSRNQLIAALVVVVARHPEFASVQVERHLELVHDTALPGPGEVGVVILRPEGRGVLLPV